MNMRLFQIALMMFIKFYAVGAIYTTLGLVLQAHGLGPYIGIAYSVGGFTTLSIGMLMGEMADRFVLPVRLLFGCNLMAAAALWFIPGQIVAGHAWAFILLLGVYTTFGDATLPVCTRIAFHALRDDVQSYAVTRAFGTAGFLASGLVTGFSGVSTGLVTFQIAAAASVVLALYALTLPATPSAAKGRGRFSFRDLLGWDALAMMRDRSFRVFIILAVVIFFPMSAYNAYLPVYLGDNHVANVGGLMTLAQATEIVLMFCLAFFLRWLGIRYILAAACFAWFVILLAFAVGDRVSFAVIVFGILLHGIGWDFFYASSEVYLNTESPEALKARAQALLRTATYGLGTILGSLLSGWIYNALFPRSGGVERWPLFWGAISAVPLLLLLMVLLYFREGKSAARLSGKDLAVPLEIPGVP